jgi:hypothetical protein
VLPVFVALAIPALPSQEALFRAVSYFSMRYFVVDYVLPKFCHLLHRFGLSLIAGMEFCFAFMGRLQKLRAESGSPRAHRHKCCAGFCGYTAPEMICPRPITSTPEVFPRADFEER